MCMPLENILKDHKIKFVPVGASHNKGIRYNEDSIISNNYCTYLKLEEENGDSCKSIKFKRAIDDAVDTENKNILSIGKGGVRAPVVAYRIASLLSSGVPFISVFGSKLIGKVVEGYKSMSGGIFSDRIFFVDEEGSDMRLSWSKSFLEATTKLEVELKKRNVVPDYFHFTAADIPFSQSDSYFLNPVYLADFAMYLNARNVFLEEQGGIFTPRNYYHKSGGIDVKEGNRFEYSKKLLPVIHAIGNQLYKHREAGSAKKLNISNLMKDVSVSSWHTIAALLNPIGLTSSLTCAYKLKKSKEYHSPSLKLAGRCAFLNTEFRIGHTDPWSMFDIDAYQDLNAYNILLSEMTSNGSKPEKLDDYFIGGKILRQFVSETILDGGLSKELILYNLNDEHNHRSMRARQLDINVDVLNSINKLDVNGALRNLSYQLKENIMLLSKLPNYEI